jgi:hypothetical protein
MAKRRGAKAVRKGLKKRKKVARRRSTRGRKAAREIVRSGSAPTAGKKARKMARKMAPARAPKAARTLASVNAPATVTKLAPLSPHDALVAAEEEVVAAKFALARPEELRVLDERERARSIPWGYGRDKVAAMAVDPERLFVYWEVTDEAIARARAELGASGDDAWLDLRVHDVTGLVFDGGNAHHVVDVGVARGDRQWFLQIGRPTSEVIVEIGLLARDGRFAKVARSHRVEFPRRAPAPPAAPEWLDVRPVAHGGGRPHFEIQRAVTHAASAPRHSESGGEREWNAARGEFFAAGAPWSRASPSDFVGAAASSSFAFWSEWTADATRTVEWSNAASSWQWLGPASEERWESGPFPLEVAELPVAVEERFGGEVTVQTWRGLTRVQYGPWSVTIRNVGAVGGGRVLARWEVRKSFIVAGSRRRFGMRSLLTRSTVTRTSIGASEQSLGASEARLEGASEQWLLGGSELRLGGASELRWLGASELAMGGRAERAFGGASEAFARGASERRLGGAGERQLGGASEASNDRGGSEPRLDLPPAPAASGSDLERTSAPASTSTGPGSPRAVPPASSAPAASPAAAPASSAAPSSASRPGRRRTPRRRS